MTVIVLIAAAQGLRGYLSRWMIEIAAGVYVGNPSKRVRDEVWKTIRFRIGKGQAVMIEPASNEQGWAVRTAGADRYFPIDLDGLTLIARRREAGISG